ncbi:putative NBD/HSP70 family sugar kinase [Actinoallomurus bryophytorum]|uniref:Putative NBD/HSP70 family sugar kinase n=1 Tax=Actinoallomurus bryophytorum TaxID=1490222 RepID=A0A543CQ23_9ACTN|nr:ROK family transcriptional regulator [Actinoallomurus bryophytorum]TQL99195.1 putative NBD/HSP70 family sugar kinase [Actinoallomurus bryophytorum]
MTSAPGSLESLRSRNRLRVLETVQQRGAISRVDITRTTGLSRTTVSSLVAELLSEGVLSERAAEPPAPSPGGGRPATLLALSPDGGGVLGVHLGHEGVRVVLADLSGDVLGERQREIDVDHLPADSLAYVADAALELVARHDVGRVIGMGVAVSAPVQLVSHALRTPSMLRDWTDIDIAAQLRDRVGVPVHVGNDANLGAMAEWTFGVGRGADDLIYLMLSDGVGAGLILNGRPYEGAAGAAGELGHVAVVDGGYVCRCGNRGCLETVVGTRALVGAVSHSRGPDTTLAEVVQLALAGDPGCHRVITDAGRTIGRALSGICAVLDPKLVIIGGKIAAAGPPLLEGVREILARRLPSAISQGVVVTAGRLGDRAEVLGAVALATRRTAVHLLSP